MDPSVTLTVSCYKFEYSIFDKCVTNWTIKCTRTQEFTHVRIHLSMWETFGAPFSNNSAGMQRLLLTLSQPYLALHNLPEVFAFQAQIHTHVHIKTCQHLACAHTCTGTQTESKREG